MLAKQFEDKENIHKNLALERTMHASRLGRSSKSILITPKNVPILMSFGGTAYLYFFFNYQESLMVNEIFDPIYSPLELFVRNRLKKRKIRLWFSKPKHEPWKIGPWTDIYACGATFYKMITGSTPPESFDRIPEDGLILPSQMLQNLKENISKENLDHAVLCALSLKIEDRFQTVDEFKKALIKIVN